MFDPDTGVFALLSSHSSDEQTMSYEAWARGSSLVLRNGDVLLAGGSNICFGGGATGYEGWQDDLHVGFTPSANVWTRWGITYPLDLKWPFIQGWGNALANLPDGRALLMGGQVPGAPYVFAYPVPAATNRTILLDIPGRSFTEGPWMNAPRIGFTATELGDGRVLIVGGGTAFRGPAVALGESNSPDARRRIAGQWWDDTPTAEIYDPATGAFTPVGALNESRQGHAAVLLPTGQVLIVGGKHHNGNGQYGYPHTMELFDPETNTFSVMEMLDYGIEEPKLVRMASGGVFVAGQVQASMNPPAMARDSAIQSFKPFVPDATGSLWTGGMTLMGEIAPPDFQVDAMTLNQGVEVPGRLDAGAFKPIADGSRPWKDIPLIVDRPALLKLNLFAGQQWNEEIPVKIEIPNDPSFIPIHTTAKPENKGVFGYRNSNKLLLDAFVLPQGNAKEGTTLKLTVQPPDMEEKALMFLIPFKPAPPIYVDLVPVDYVYKDAAGARQQYTLSDAEMNAFKASIAATIKELYPVSLSQVNVTVQPFRAIWSEDGKDATGANLWRSPYEAPPDPGQPDQRIVFSNLLDSSAAARATKWGHLQTYFVQQMMIKSKSGTSDNTWYGNAFPKNRYIVGVVPAIPEITVLSTPGAAYSAGGGATPNEARTEGSHFAVALNQSSLDGAHEIGHVHGRRHSPCGSIERGDPNWPSGSAYSGAAIGVPGWSVLVRANAPDQAATKKDIMCYPKDRSWYWISDYNFYYLFQWEKKSQELGDQ